jgi:hypothetical protein
MKLHNRQLVFGYDCSDKDIIRRFCLTVDCQIPQGCASGTLHFDVWTLKEEEDGSEGIFVDFAHIFAHQHSRPFKRAQSTYLVR